jgi:hypothetical protein
MTKIRTSRKQELRSNQLVDVLAGVGRAIRKYAVHIAVGVAVLGAGAFLWWQHASSQARKEGRLGYSIFENSRALQSDWRTSDAPNKPSLDGFKANSEEAAGTPLAATALLDYGNALLSAATTDPKLVGAGPDAAAQRGDMLSKAKAAFEQALQASGRTETTDVMAYVGLSGVAGNQGDSQEAARLAAKAQGLGGASASARQLAAAVQAHAAEDEAPVVLAASRPRSDAESPLMPLPPMAPGPLDAGSPLPVEPPAASRPASAPAVEPTDGAPAPDATNGSPAETPRG